MTGQQPPPGVPDDLPTPPPLSEKATPSGTPRPREPMPSAVLLERAMSNSEVRAMSPEEAQVVLNERSKEVETTVGQTFDVVNEMRGELDGFKGEMRTLIKDLRDEVFSHITPLKARYAGLAGLAVVASAVGGALLTYLVNLILHALR